jgi:membrane carboxypeptidase/penicillin-binding protein
MQGALKDKPVMEFTKPPEVVSAWIDVQTNALANTGCPKKQEEFYLTGTEPAVRCPQHGGEPISPAGSVDREPKIGFPFW